MIEILSLKECIDKFNRKQKVYIPLYQRNYKWFDKKENSYGNPSAEKLIDDLIEHYKNNKNNIYNIGMITVYDCGNKYHILDGQQRMITLSLVIKAIDQKSLQVSKWFKLEFERDIGFDNMNSQDLPRYNFIYQVSKQTNGVDVKRMKKNYEVIEKSIKEAKIDCKDFYDFIMSKINIVFRETKQEPIEEFLNMNFNKTPFGISDYLKAYMVIDSKESNEVITSIKVIELWKKIKYLLYKLDESSDTENLENEMYKLIKYKYEKRVDIERMEMLFCDRYKDKGKEYLNKKCETRLEEEYNILTYYYKSMQNILDEFWIVDQNGKQRPNYNVYSAYKLLCKQQENIQFFEILNNGDNTDILENIYKFNLSKTIDKNEFNLSNQFMESLLVSKVDENKYYEQHGNFQKDSIYDEINKKEYVEKASNFQEIYSIFTNKFNEYLRIIDKGKGYLNKIEQSKLILSDEHIRNTDKEKDYINKNGQEKLSLKEILGHPKVKQIKIPHIQRDYVMGSNKEYLKKYLEKISFYYCWNCFNQIKSSFEPINYNTVDLFEKTIFINKKDFNGGIKNPLEEIVAEERDRKKKYDNVISKIPDLKKQHEINSFVGGIPSNEYKKFCAHVNELKKGFDKIIEKLKECSLKKNITKKFNSSVIMGHLDSRGVLWIYDGQQRLTTLLVLLGYLQDDRFDKKLYDVFSFEGRDGANNCLKLLDKNNNKEQLLKQMEQYIDDTTSHSIYRLIKNYEEFNKDSLVKIDTEFLLNGVRFEFVQVDSIGDAEQLFMDLNDGLKLDECEKYKAELSYNMKAIYKDQVDKRKEFLLLLDNIWLNRWGREENAIEILQWCIQQSYYERIGYEEKRTSNDLTNLNEEVLECAKEAMDALTKLSELSKSSKYLWINILLNNKEITEDEYTSTANEIKFGKDFKEFIELYAKFAQAKKISVETILKQIYIMIKEFRDTGQLKINQNKECETEESLLKLRRDMLTNRVNKAEFDEIIKWEEVKEVKDYKNVQKNKSYSLENAIRENLNKKNIELQLDKDEEMILFQKDIVELIYSKHINCIKDNLEYYLYKKNNDEIIEIIFKLSESMINEWRLEFLYNNKYLKFDDNKQLCGDKENTTIVSKIINNNKYYYISYKDNQYIFTTSQIYMLNQYSTVKSELKKELNEKNKFNLKEELNKEWSKNKSLSSMALQRQINIGNFYKQIKTHKGFEHISNEIKIKRGEIYLNECKEYEDYMKDINYINSKIDEVSKSSNKIKKEIITKIEKIIDNLLKHYKYIKEYTDKENIFESFITEIYCNSLLQGKQSQEFEKIYWISREYLYKNDSLRQEIFKEYIKNIKTLNNQSKKKMRRLFKEIDFKININGFEKSISEEEKQYLSYIGKMK